MPPTDAKPGQEIAFIEWLTAAFGLLTVLAAIGLLSYYAISGSGSHPNVSISVLAIIPQSTGHLVRIRVANAGTMTAAQLAIEGTLSTAGGAEEQSQVTLDYLPGRSEREAGLFFTGDPRKGRLEIRATGFQNP